LIRNIVSEDEGYYICTAINQYGSSITKFQLRVINLKKYFIQRSFFYGSILIGLLLCCIFLTCALINHYRHKTSLRIRRKSSTTDETISSLAKQQEHIQHDYQEQLKKIFTFYLNKSFQS
jgi:hypothetical protein